MSSTVFLCPSPRVANDPFGKVATSAVPRRSLQSEDGSPLVTNVQLAPKRSPRPGTCKAEPTRRFVHAKDLACVKSSVESFAPFAHLGWRGRHPLPVFTARSLRSLEHTESTEPENIKKSQPQNKPPRISSVPSNPLSGWVGQAHHSEPLPLLPYWAC